MLKNAKIKGLGVEMVKYHIRGMGLCRHFVVISVHCLISSLLSVISSPSSRIFPVSSAFGTSCTAGGSSGSGADRLKRFGAGIGRSGSVSSGTLRKMESVRMFLGIGQTNGSE